MKKEFSAMAIATVIACATAALSGATTSSATNAPSASPGAVGRRHVRASERTPLERAQRHMAALQRHAQSEGGYIAKPNSRKGRIVFVNEQTQVPGAALKEVADTIAVRDRLDVEFVDAVGGERTTPRNAEARKAELKANAAVFVTESDEYPSMSIAAPEGAWSIVNAAAVCKGASNEAFKKTRLIKMMERGFYTACGAMNSQYPGSMMGLARNVEELDRLSSRAPLDVIGRTMANLAEMGVTQEIFATYKKACEEGWAPAPTNDIQKAIWDKVHTPPKAPMKIEFDPKKGR